MLDQLILCGRDKMAKGIEVDVTTGEIKESVCEIAPYVQTEEEIKQNQERISIILRQLTGEISMEDAVKEQRKLTTYSRK
jgi:hypothetical protein